MNVKKSKGQTFEIVGIHRLERVYDVRRYAPLTDFTRGLAV